MAAFAAMFVFIWALINKDFWQALLAGTGTFLFCAMIEWFYVLSAFSSFFALMEKATSINF